MLRLVFCYLCHFLWMQNINNHLQKESTSEPDGVKCIPTIQKPPIDSKTLLLSLVTLKKQTKPTRNPNKNNKKHPKTTTKTNKKPTPQNQPNNNKKNQQRKIGERLKSRDSHSEYWTCDGLWSQQFIKCAILVLEHNHYKTLTFSRSIYHPLTGTMQCTHF